MSAIAVDDVAYETVNDPALLRAALRELDRVRAFLTLFTDVATEMPEHYVGSVVDAKILTTAVVSLLRQRATDRLAKLEAELAPGGVTVVRVPSTEARPVDGMRVLPMLTRPELATTHLSTVLLVLPSMTASTPQLCPDHESALLMDFGTLTVVWLDAAGQQHETPVRVREQAHIGAGVPHRLVNTGSVTVVAVHTVACADALAGVEYRPELAAGVSGLSLPAGHPEPAETGEEPPS